MSWWPLRRKNPSSAELSVPAATLAPAPVPVLAPATGPQTQPSPHGSLQVYSGTRPASPDDPLNADNVLLVQLDCPPTGFRPARRNGRRMMLMGTMRGVVCQDGDATFVRLCEPDGNVVRDLSVGSPGHPLASRRNAEVMFSQIRMERGALVTIHDFMLTEAPTVVDFVDCDWTEQDARLELSAGEPRRLTTGT